MIYYISTNWIEIVGAILSLIYLILTIQEKVTLWFFGIVSSAFYVVVFYQTKFYADMSLQFLYIALSVYGWMFWEKDKSKKLETTTMNYRDWIITILGTAFVYMIYYLILSRFTDSTIPKSDSLVGALSVIGTWMIARKFLENWLVWIAADMLCIGLYFYKGLNLTGYLFIIYTVMAGVGYWQWKKAM